MVKTMKSEHIQTTFPKELLEQSIDNRLAYFRDRFFSHPNVYQAIEDLKRIITHPVGKRSVNLYGPTGTGKTTTLTVVRKHFTEQSGQARGPIVSVSAFSDEPHRFSWKDFYRKILHEIAIQYAPAQIAIDVQGIRYGADGQLSIHDRVTVSQLRETVIQALLQMRPLALFISLPYRKYVPISNKGRLAIRATHGTLPA
jgi:DNA polymerase III delta prime subunit